MFDSTATFKMELKYSTVGPVTLELRYPNDEEWIQRVSARRMVMRRMSRGQTEVEIRPNHAKDHELYQRLALNGTPPPSISAGEATAVLDAMATCEARDIHIDGSQAVVELRVPNGMVKHTLSVPTMDQVLRFKAQASRTVELPMNVMESRQNLRVSGELWQECRGQVEGGQGAVPIVHKDVAIRQLIEFIEREMQPSDEEASF